MIMSNKYYGGKSRVSDPIHFQVGVHRVCGRDWGVGGLTQLTFIFTHSRTLHKLALCHASARPRLIRARVCVLLRGWGAEL